MIPTPVQKRPARARTTTTTTTTTTTDDGSALRKHLPQKRVVAVAIHVVHPDVALQVVRARVAVLLVRTEGADVTRAGVDEAVPVQRGWVSQSMCF